MSLWGRRQAPWGAPDPALRSRLARLDVGMLRMAAGDSLNVIGKAVEAYALEPDALHEALYGARQLVALLEELQERTQPVRGGPAATHQHRRLRDS